MLHTFMNHIQKSLFERYSTDYTDREIEDTVEGQGCEWTEKGWVGGNSIGIDLTALGLKSLPKFYKVNTNFDCSDNDLPTLIGAPEYVEGEFVVERTGLKTLKGSPRVVKEGFICSDNSLESLEGAPEKVGGEFDCSSNNLITLKGAPRYVGGDFNCRSNPLLKSLDHLPKTIRGEILVPQHLEKELSLLKRSPNVKKQRASSREVSSSDIQQINDVEAPTVFQNDRVIVVTPKTKEAACKYGAGTKWCAVRGGDTDFNICVHGYYAKPYYILPKRGEKIFVAVMVGKTTAYNSKNMVLSSNSLFRILETYDIPVRIFTPFTSQTRSILRREGELLFRS